MNCKQLHHHSNNSSCGINYSITRTAAASPASAADQAVIITSISISSSILGHVEEMSNAAWLIHSTKGNSLSHGTLLFSQTTTYLSLQIWSGRLWQHSQFTTHWPHSTMIAPHNTGTTYGTTDTRIGTRIRTRIVTHSWPQLQYCQMGQAKWAKEKLLEGGGQRKQGKSRNPTGSNILLLKIKGFCFWSLEAHGQFITACLLRELTKLTRVKQW